MDDLEGMVGETCLRQAYSAIFHGDFERALLWFQKAIDQEPDNASYHYKASITCARSGKTELAESYARRAAELDPEDPVFALNLQTIEARLMTAEARTLLELPVAETERAKALLLEAETLDPLSVDTKVLLGLAFRMRQDFRPAIACLRAALSLEPQHAEAARLLREWRNERRRLLQSQLSRPQPKRK